MLKSEDVKAIKPCRAPSVTASVRLVSLVNIDDTELDGMLRDAQTPRNSFMPNPSASTQDLNFTRVNA